MLLIRFDALCRPLFLESSLNPEYFWVVISTDFTHESSKLSCKLWVQFYLPIFWFLISIPSCLRYFCHLLYTVFITLSSLHNENFLSEKYLLPAFCFLVLVLLMLSEPIDNGKEFNAFWASLACLWCGLMLEWGELHCLCFFLRNVQACSGGSFVTDLTMQDFQLFQKVPFFLSFLHWDLTEWQVCNNLT